MSQPQAYPGRELPAVKSTSLGKTSGYFAAFLLLGLTTASLGPTLPGIAGNTGSALAAVSVLFTARSLGYMAGSLLVGRLYDRYNGHAVISLALLASGLAAFFVPQAPSLALVAALMLVLGTAEGGVDVGGNTLLVWEHGAQVGPYLNGLHFFFGLGAFLAPLLVGRSLAWSGSIQWTYWALAIVALPAALWLARLPSPAMPAHVADGGQGHLRWSLVFLIAAFFFLYVGAEAGFGGWVYVFAVDQLALEATGSAAYLAAAFWGAFTLGRLLGIPLAQRFRPGSILLADLFGCLASLALPILWPGFMWAVWLGTLGLGVFMASIFPTMIALAGQRMLLTGRVTGFFFVGVSLGGMTLPWLIGQLFERVGPRSMLWLVAAALCLALGIFVAIWAQPRQNTPTNHL